MVTKVTADDIVDKVTSGGDGALLINDLKRATNEIVDAKEEDLSNPTTDGQVLSSTAAGVRSWITPAGGGAVDSVAGKTGIVVLEKADVGLSNVNNTADADKPVSTATSTALSNKVDTDGAKVLSANDFTDVLKTKLDNVVAAPVDSVAGKTGVVTLAKADVSLDNVDNTSDADKPVSTAQSTAIGLKEDNLGNPTTNGDVLTSQTDGTRSWETPAAGEALGNPSVDDQLLSSKTDGTRSWVDPPSGGVSVNSSFNLFQDALMQFVAGDAGISASQEGRVATVGSVAERVYIKPKWLVPKSTHFEVIRESESATLLTLTELWLSPVTAEGIDFSSGVRLTISGGGEVQLWTVQSGTTPRDRTFSGLLSGGVIPNINIGEAVSISIDTPVDNTAPQLTVKSGAYVNTVAIGNVGTGILGWDLSLHVNKPIPSAGTTFFNFGTEAFQFAPQEGACLLSDNPQINNNAVIVWEGSIIGLVATSAMDYPAGAAIAGNSWRNKGYFAPLSSFIPSRGWLLVDEAAAIPAAAFVNVGSSASAGSILSSVFSGNTLGFQSLNILNAGTNSLINPTINSIIYKPKV